MMKKTPKLKQSERDKSSQIWRITIAIGFIIAQGVLLFTFYETQKTTRQIETIRLARDLYNEFYLKENLYRKVRNSIESCSKLYKSWGGEFTHDTINRYLGFFEDLGFYEKRNILGKDIIGHFFGAYIIEAYENKELRKYIALVRKNFTQSAAFENFETLAKKLEKEPDFVLLAKTAKTMCRSPEEPSQ